MNKCIDCGKELSRNKEAVRCKKCTGKIHSKIMKGKNNPMYGLKDRNSPNWKGGWKCFCIDCGNKVSNYHIKRCQKCWHVYAKSHGYIFNTPKGKNSPHFGKIYHSKYYKYKTIWLNSSWELAYAKYLDKNNIKWLYEPKAFDLGETTYRPDFYLPETNEYIEIKGYWRGDALNKFLAFKLLYPEIKIEVLNKIKLRFLKVI